MIRITRLAPASILAAGALAAAVLGQEVVLPPQPVPLQAPTPVSNAPPSAATGSPAGPTGPPPGPAAGAPTPPAPFPATPAPGQPAPLPAATMIAPPPGYIISPAPGGYFLTPAAPPVPCEPSGNVWFNAEYLLWWTRSTPVPPLVTSGLPADIGVPGPANAGTLFNGGDVNGDARSGGRFTLGFWFRDSHVIGLETTYLFLAQHGQRLASGVEDAEPPDAPPGTFDVTLSSFLQGAEVNALTSLPRWGNFQVDLLGGFRFLELDERLRVEQDFTPADLSELDVWDDQFRTRNNFYGGQIGARAHYNHERFFADITGKVALGVTDQEVHIDGGLSQITSTVTAGPLGFPLEDIQVTRSPFGGLLADPASFHRDRFTVVPEIGFNVGYQITNYARVAMGYTFIYWSSVARPGDQVGGIPKATDFWAQGLNFTLGLTF